MSILKSPWLWGLSAVGLLFMNSKSKADELAPSTSPPKTPAKPPSTPKPKPPVSTAPTPAPIPKSPPIEQGGSPNQTFATPTIPKTARVVTAFADGRAYEVAQLGGGEYLVISKTNDAYLKFGQGGEIESGAVTPEALALLRSDMQKFDQNLFNPRARGGGV